MDYEKEFLRAERDMNDGCLAEGLASYQVLAKIGYTPAQSALLSIVGNVLLDRAKINTEHSDPTGMHTFDAASFRKNAEDMLAVVRASSVDDKIIESEYLKFEGVISAYIYNVTKMLEPEKAPVGPARNNPPRSRKPGALLH